VSSAAMVVSCFSVTIQAVQGESDESSLFSISQQCPHYLTHIFLSQWQGVTLAECHDSDVQVFVPSAF